MARPIASPLGQTVPTSNLQPGFEFEDLPAHTPVIHDIRGMWTSGPRNKRPPGSALDAKNARLGPKGLKRRSGTLTYRTDADANAIVGLTGLLDQTGVGKLVRITPSGMHYSASGTGWTAYTNNAPLVLDGTVLRPTTAQYLDDLYVAGWTELLQVVDSTKAIESVASGPGQAKFIVNAADRIILANFADEPYKIKWSANAAPTDWTSASSGEENLVQGAGGVGDAITGLFAVEQEIVILRQRNIWIGSRQPFGDAPFRFSQIVSEVGCDMPYSAVRVPGGIIFADRLTRGVYFYQPGNYPQRLNDAIEGEIFDEIVDADWCQAAFDPETFSYILGITTTEGSTNMDKFWVYNILKKEWTYDDGPTALSLSSFNFGTGIAIDALTGTIDSLTGTIDNLTTFDSSARHYRGTDGGSVFYFDEDADTDYDSTAFEFVVMSQDITPGGKRYTLTDLFFKVEITRGPGTVSVKQSKNGTTTNTGKSIAVTTSTTSLKARKNLITGNAIHWYVSATNTDVMLTEMWCRLLEKGLQL